jgi:hypothetical protein
MLTPSLFVMLCHFNTDWEWTTSQRRMFLLCDKLNREDLNHPMSFQTDWQFIYTLVLTDLPSVITLSRKGTIDAD